MSFKRTPHEKIINTKQSRNKNKNKKSANPNAFKDLVGQFNQDSVDVQNVDYSSQLHLNLPLFQNDSESNVSNDVKFSHDSVNVNVDYGSQLLSSNLQSFQQDLFALPATAPHVSNSVPFINHLRDDEFNL